MKNSKKVVKITTIAMMIMMILISSTVVFAAPDPKVYDGSQGKMDTGKIDTFGQNIVQVISTIGSIASVIVLIVLGIKYMMGSAEEKAEYKKTLLPYVIGAALVFAASFIASVVFSAASSLLAQ